MLSSLCLYWMSTDSATKHPVCTVRMQPPGLSTCCCAVASQEIVQEQITRVLLERLIVNRPHPWGLLITFIELIKNPRCVSRHPANDADCMPGAMRHCALLLLLLSTIGYRWCT